MRGSIRVAIGFMVVFGAVGTLDIDPSASILVQSGLAVVGVVVVVVSVVTSLCFVSVVALNVVSFMLLLLCCCCCY